MRNADWTNIILLSFQHLDDRHLAVRGDQHDGVQPHLPHLPGVHHQAGGEQQRQHQGHLLLQVSEQVQNTQQLLSSTGLGKILNGETLQVAQGRG